MCGIVGYIGEKPAAPILMEGLKKLEYRGYDSAGVALLEKEGLTVIKTKERLATLSTLVAEAHLQGTAGIGHTRWATHGEPSVENAHPHFNTAHTLAVVHNGIIENYQPLKEELSDLGYVFLSQTDTEVIAHLLDRYYNEYRDGKKALAALLPRLEGSYALGVLFADDPDALYVARKDSPLVIGLGEDCNYIASDAPAILKYTRRVIYIDNREIAVVRRNGVQVYSGELLPQDKAPVLIAWDIEAAEKNGFAHFMMKEIHEQPAAIRDTIHPHIAGGKVVLPELALAPEQLASLKRIYFVACGSAAHVGVVGKYVMESLARIPTEWEIASEFRYRDPVLEENSLCVIISQSGETADSLAALREAKGRGLKTLAIVNVLGSSIAREADGVIYTHAGPEISVATTKAYSAQLSVVYLLALYLADIRGTLSESKRSALIDDLLSLPDKVTALLEQKGKLRVYAQRLLELDHAFFIGRGIDYAAALEGSLKLKEVSYIHSEAYAAGELKHGTISLVENGTPIAVLATQPALFDKVNANAAEVIARGARIFALTTAANQSLLEKAEFAVVLPDIAPIFAASLSVIPLQLFAYFVSTLRGLDVDKPRNLAKSVTVE